MSTETFTKFKRQVAVTGHAVTFFSLLCRLANDYEDIFTCFVKFGPNPPPPPPPVSYISLRAQVYKKQPFIHGLFTLLSHVRIIDTSE